MGTSTRTTRAQKKFVLFLSAVQAAFVLMFCLLVRSVENVRMYSISVWHAVVDRRRYDDVTDGVEATRESAEQERARWADINSRYPSKQTYNTFRCLQD